MPGYRLMEIREAPATRGDIMDLGHKLVYPPLFTRDQNMLDAEKYLEMKKAVLFDDTLSNADKIILSNMYDTQFDIFKTKALANLNTKIKQSSNVSDVNNLIDSSSGNGNNNIYKQRKEIVDIIQPIAKNQKQRSIRILKLLKSDDWNWKGELKDPSTGKYIDDTNMTDLVRYELLVNKSSSRKPRGYDKFKALVSVNTSEPVASSSTTTRQPQWSSSTKVSSSTPVSKGTRSYKKKKSAPGAFRDILAGAVENTGQDFLSRITS